MPPTIGENLRRALERHGLKPAVLAARLGYSDRAMVDHWLSGRRRLTRASLERVADALGCDPNEIDPKGEAYTAAQRKARSAEKRALQTSHTPADKMEVTQRHPPEAGALMAEPGGLPPLPDYALFSQILGRWRVLSPQQRRELVEYGRQLEHGDVVVGMRTVVRKKAAR